MSVRLAEIVMACVMAAFSVYLMWKSAELNIGWIEDEGPGGGAWPFWLSAVMLLSCAGIAWNWWRRSTPLARSTEPFIGPAALRIVLQVVVLLTVVVALFDVIGTYCALFLFMLVYLAAIGRHRLRVALAWAVTTPVVTFLFFEILIKVILPKGVTEPLFYPIFRFFGMGGL